MCLSLLICSVLPFSFIYIVPNLVCITMIIIIIIIIIVACSMHTARRFSYFLYRKLAVSRRYRHQHDCLTPGCTCTRGVKTYLDLSRATQHGSGLNSERRMASQLCRPRPDRSGRCLGPNRVGFPQCPMLNRHARAIASVWNSEIIKLIIIDNLIG